MTAPRIFIVDGFGDLTSTIYSVAHLIAAFPVLAAHASATVPEMATLAGYQCRAIAEGDTVGVKGDWLWWHMTDGA